MVNTMSHVSRGDLATCAAQRLPSWWKAVAQEFDQTLVPQSGNSHSQPPAWTRAKTTIDALSDELLEEIFLRIPSLATLCCDASNFLWSPPSTSPIPPA
ncbi:hypothetical protein E2562_008143 [Oryza meyeriana var. granulata]|uniref:F-box domain-containing protein n=1 Tax=Oryza meyeriana var. granulata TaxID=110450 RepID=A0A6G1CEH3_9ORYZ|nr:hypothetical protein E2562_008143 [Oryza meyeriana var. granulata]